MRKYYIKKETAIKVGANLKSARKANGLSQKEIADKLGVTWQHYSRFETGIYELSYDLVIGVCKILDITPNELYDYGI